MKIAKSLLFIIVLGMLTACTPSPVAPTRAEVIREYTQPFAQKRQQLVAIAENLPPAGSVTENSRCGALEPPLILKENDPQEYTGAMFMYDQLLNPDIDLHKNVSFDISIGGSFLRALRWTGPDNPMSSGTMQERDGEFANELATALAHPYLVVNRLAEYVPSEIIGQSNKFIPGYVVVEGFVISMKNDAILCSYRVEAEMTTEKVKYYKRHSDSKAAQSALEWALEVDVRQAIQSILSEITGGTIEYSTTSLRKE